MERTTTNAREEFIKTVGTRVVKCASVTRFDEEDDFDEVGVTYVLNIGYSEEEYKAFLYHLDFAYIDVILRFSDVLLGTIWFTDNSWSTRCVADYSEWWEDHSVPDIPKNLIRS